MEDQVKPKRPRWVWVIGIFFGLSAAWGIFSLSLVLLGLVPQTDAQRAYFASLTIVDYGLMIGIGGCNLAGSVLLFMMKKSAYRLFAISLGLNVLTSIWHITSRGASAALGGAGLVGAVIGLGILVAILAYSKRLAERGLLA